MQIKQLRIHEQKHIHTYYLQIQFKQQQNKQRPTNRNICQSERESKQIKVYENKKNALNTRLQSISFRKIGN